MVMRLSSDRFLNVKPFTENDLQWERDCYNRFHTENEFPNFIEGYHAAFTVSNDKRVILAAGVKPIAEIVMLSDLNANVRDRIEAYYKVLEASVFIAADKNYKQLHAFTHPLSRWGGQLARAGFKESANKVHILEL